MSEVNYEAYYNTIYQMDPYQLQSFRHDVFRVRDDEDMKALEESVRVNGIMTPILAFWNEYGNLEIISGHRRIYVAKKMEFPSVPVIIKSVDLSQVFLEDTMISISSFPKFWSLYRTWLIHEYSLPLINRYYLHC